MEGPDRPGGGEPAKYDLDKPAVDLRFSRAADPKTVTLPKSADEFKGSNDSCGID